MVHRVTKSQAWLNDWACKHALRIMLCTSGRMYTLLWPFSGIRNLFKGGFLNEKKQKMCVLSLDSDCSFIACQMRKFRTTKIF